MRNAIIISLLLFLTASCSAQQDPPSCLSVTGGDAHDFGEITHDDKPEHRFELRNDCSDTVRITHVKAACGCTTASASERTLPPGGTTTVDVQFYPPRTTNGHIAKSVAVWVDHGKQKQYVLRVEADIRSYFEVTPAKVDMETIKKGTAAETVVRLKNVSQEEQRIAEIMTGLAIEFRGADGSAPPQVIPLENAEFSPRQFTLAPGASQDITVRLTPVRPGKLMGSMVIYAGTETRQVEFSGIIK